jgi:hypothetical protein
MQWNQLAVDARGILFVWTLLGFSACRDPSGPAAPAPRAGLDPEELRSNQPQTRQLRRDLHMHASGRAQ